MFQQAFAFILSILFFSSLFFLSTEPHSAARAGEGYDYYLSCEPARRTESATPAILLIGGSESGSDGEDAATKWFLERAGRGDYLVIRYDEIGEQADWICNNYQSEISSAAELSIFTRKAANKREVARRIRRAEALFIAGGDQNDYEDTWKDTLVEDAINYLINEKKVPVAGTSAGMAILGEFYYAPSRKNEVLSSEILNDPFHPNTEEIFEGNFLKIDILDNVITDTHLNRRHGSDNETRYGRLFGMLARVAKVNGTQIPSYGIGLEEGAFVGIENNIARVFGNGKTDGADAYFLKTNGVMPEELSRGSPLVWNNNGTAVKVYRIPGTEKGSGSFNLNDWKTADGGSWEYWFTTGGESGFTRQGEHLVELSSGYYGYQCRDKGS